MGIITFTIDEQQFSAQEEETVLDVARQHKLNIPTLCHLDGLSDIGACRLCLIEIEGSPKLMPACTTRPIEGMIVRTNTDRLKRYRRIIVEFLASEGNHQCSVCVVNSHCELQNLAYNVGLTHVRVPYLYPSKMLDATHKGFIMDRNRCVLCTRCVRVCNEVEGAHVWDISNRGIQCKIISDLDEPWGKSLSCTSCGKCVLVCPTGALIAKGESVAEMEKKTDFLKYIVTARKKKEWISIDSEEE
jgi:bidirectional [NiFe] hydrogenase diaphorase subunit